MKISMDFHHKKSSTDAAMEVKDIKDEALTKGKIAALVNLDVKDAFDAVLWSVVLKIMKYFSCPRILYNLTKN